MLNTHLGISVVDGNKNGSLKMNECSLSSLQKPSTGPKKYSTQARNVVSPHQRY